MHLCSWSHCSRRKINNKFFHDDDDDDDDDDVVDVNFYHCEVAAIA